MNLITISVGLLINNWSQLVPVRILMFDEDIVKIALDSMGASPEANLDKPNMVQQVWVGLTQKDAEILLKLLQEENNPVCKSYMEAVQRQVKGGRVVNAHFSGPIKYTSDCDPVVHKLVKKTYRRNPVVRKKEVFDIFIPKGGDAFGGGAAF